MSEYVWFDSEGRGITQEEADNLADVWLHSRERLEHERQTDTETKRLAFVKWLVSTGQLVVGEPDGSATWHPHRVMRPIPHIEWDLYTDIPTIGITPPDDDLPPAA